MKELTIYPHVMDCGIDCVEDDEGTLRYGAELDDFARAKHFTDAELSAEYMRSEADFYAVTAGFEPREGFTWPASPGVFRRRIDTLLRFAMTDHALEASDVRE